MTAWFDDNDTSATVGKVTLRLTDYGYTVVYTTGDEKSTASRSRIGVISAYFYTRNIDRSLLWPKPKMPSWLRNLALPIVESLLNVVLAPLPRRAQVLNVACICPLRLPTAERPRRMRPAYRVPIARLFV